MTGSMMKQEAAFEVNIIIHSFPLVDLDKCLQIVSI